MKKSWITLFALFLFQCDNEDPAPANPVNWNQLGLEGRIVNQLEITNSNIYAATDAGLYHATTSDPGSWELIGFDGVNVSSIAILSNEKILSAVMNEGKNLYSSENSGQTWQSIENNFGGESVEEINDFEVDPDNDLIIYGSGTSVIARSEDQGKTWTPVYGEWQGFGSGVDVVEINPANDHIWAGGQGAIENGFLLKSENNGEDWQEWQDLVENPTVVKEIVFSPDNAQTLYIGYEGALQKTENGGDSYTSMIESDENRFFFGIELSDENPEIVFSGGWLKRFDEPQPFILSYSLDGGDTWTELENQKEDYGGIMEIKLLEENDDHKKFLIGLYKGGIYEVTIDNSQFE